MRKYDDTKCTFALKRGEDGNMKISNVLLHLRNTFTLGRTVLTDLAN